MKKEITFLERARHRALKDRPIVQFCGETVYLSPLSLIEHEGVGIAAKEHSIAYLKDRGLEPTPEAVQSATKSRSNLYTVISVLSDENGNRLYKSMDDLPGLADMITAAENVHIIAEANAYISNAHGSEAQEKNSPASDSGATSAD